MQRNYPEIEDLLNDQGLTPGEEWWKDFDSKINLFSMRSDSSGPPRNRERKEQLESLERKANELAMEMENMSSHLRGDICLTDIEDGEYTKYSNRLDETCSNLRWLAKQAARVLENIEKDKGGRPTKFWLKMFILNLARLWKDAGGKTTIPYDPYNNTYTGALLEFLKLSCDEIGFSYKNKYALGQMARRILPTNRD